MRFLLNAYKKRKQAATDLSTEHCLRVARATLRRTRYCFLVTSGQGSWSSARLVEPICNLKDFAFCIGTNPSLRKVREIRANPKVTLAFGNAKENANLVVYGAATLVLDRDT